MMNPEGKPANTDRESRETDALEKRLQSMLQRWVRELPPDIEPTNRQESIINRIDERGRPLFPNNLGGFADCIAELRKKRFESIEELTGGVANEFARFALQIYSPIEFETLVRNGSAEREGWFTINEALTYELADPGHINLHIPPIFTKEPMEAFRLFTDGLHELAHRLETEEQLTGVQEIRGHSWIVFEQPKLVNRLGFTVSDSDPSTHKALATMSREDFLKRFGT